MRVLLSGLIAVLFVFPVCMAGSAPANVARVLFTARIQPGQTKKKSVDSSSMLNTTEVSKTVKLEIELRNMGVQSNVFTLDYYFTCRNFHAEQYQGSAGSGDYCIFDYASESFPLNPMESTKKVLESHPVTKEVIKWWDDDKWERGDKAGGFIVIIKDQDGNIVETKAQPNKLKALIANPAKLTEFLAQTNGIAPRKE